MDPILGKQCKDKITGFIGIATSKCEYLYGCSQFLLTPIVDKDCKTQDSKWFDEGRIEVIGDGITPEQVQAEKPGGDNREHPDNY